MDYKSLQIKTKKATSILQMKIFAYKANMCMSSILLRLMKVKYNPLLLNSTAQGWHGGAIVSIR